MNKKLIQTSFFTARIRRMGGGTVFSLFVSSQLDGGGGRGLPCLAKWGELVPPSQVRTGGYPISGRNGRHPILLMGAGGPHPLSEWGYLPVSRMWVPPPIQVYPQLEQHTVYLLRSGRYASCVHAGLSCFHI